MDAAVQDTRVEVALLVLTKETLQLSAVNQDKTTFLELGVLQLALLTSIETQEEAAKIVMIAVMDVQKEQTQTATLATLETTSKRMVQEPVCASLGTTETAQFVLNATLAVMDALEQEVLIANLVTLQTTSKRTQETVCASLGITETGQYALNAILVATSAMTLETLNVLLVLTKEIPQTNVVHQDSTTTTLLVKLVQLMSTLMELTV